MNTTNAVLMTGLIVVAGRWAGGKQLDIRLAVGTAGLVLFLAVINSSSPDLASKLAMLVLVSAVFLYGPTITKKAGLSK
jgi:hypothetical protein